MKFYLFNEETTKPELGFDYMFKEPADTKKDIWDFFDEHHMDDINDDAVVESYGYATTSVYKLVDGHKLIDITADFDFFLGIGRKEGIEAAKRIYTEMGVLKNVI